MKNLFLMLIMLIGVVLHGQEISQEEWRNMSRKERRAYKEQQLLKSREEIKALIDSREWVLEAHSLQDRYGETYIMEPNLNFVGVAGENTTVQLGASGEIGYNGVGGITLDGRISNYEIKEGKKAGSPISVRLEATGGFMGHVTLWITVNADGNATAQVNDLEGNRLTYRGVVKSLNESSVYKGSTLP